MCSICNILDHHKITDMVRVGELFLLDATAGGANGKDAPLKIEHCKWLYIPLQNKCNNSWWWLG